MYLLFDTASKLFRFLAWLNKLGLEVCLKRSIKKSKTKQFFMLFQIKSAAKTKYNVQSVRFYYSELSPSHRHLRPLICTHSSSPTSRTPSSYSFMWFKYENKTSSKFWCIIQIQNQNAGKTQTSGKETCIDAICVKTVLNILRLWIAGLLSVNGRCC